MNDNKLLKSIKQKDEQAIAILMTKYSRLLWKIASDILCQIGSDADTEEVVADVFISIWQNPEAFDEKRSNLKNYLCLLCKSKAIDRFRYLSRIAAEDIDELSISDYLGLEDLIIQKEEIQNVYDAIQTLSAEEQCVVIRRLIFNQKPKMISKATNLSVRQVENIAYITADTATTFLSSIRMVIHQSMRTLKASLWNRDKMSA